MINPADPLITLDYNLLEDISRIVSNVSRDDVLKKSDTHQPPRKMRKVSVLTLPTGVGITYPLYPVTPPPAPPTAPPLS